MSGNNRPNKNGNYPKSNKSTLTTRNAKRITRQPTNTEAEEELFTRHSKNKKTSKFKPNDSSSQNHSNIHNKELKKSPNFTQNSFQIRGFENKKSPPTSFGTHSTALYTQQTPQDSNDEDYFDGYDLEPVVDQYYNSLDNQYKNNGQEHESEFSEDEHYQGEDYQGEDGNKNENYENNSYQNEGYQNENYENECYQNEEYPDEHYQEEEYQDNNDTYNEDLQVQQINPGKTTLSTVSAADNSTNTAILNTYHEEDSDFLYPDDIDFVEARKIQNSQRKKYIELEKIPDPDKRYKLEDAMTIIGTCEAMCPQLEIIQREFERKIDKNEKDPVTNRIAKHKMVKAFSRSAAGQSTPLPNELRTINALEATTNYLIKDLMRENTFSETHTFIRDRTRQIRKDISVQHIFSLKAVNIYETIARFHILGLRHCISIKENMKLEKEEFSRTLVGLKDQYLALHTRNRLNLDLEFFAYYTLNFLETESELGLPLRHIRDQANPNKRDLISFVLKACDLYSDIVDEDGIRQEFDLAKNDPLARINSFFSMFNQDLWDFPIYLVTVVCEKMFDYVRYRALKILQYLKQNLTIPFNSYKLDPFTANLRFKSRDETVEFLTKYNFKVYEKTGKERIYIDLAIPLPKKPLETVVIGCESIVQPLRLHCKSFTDTDLILGSINYNIPSTIDLKQIYIELDPDSTKPSFTAISPPHLPSGFSPKKLQPKLSTSASVFSNFPQTLAITTSVLSSSLIGASPNNSAVFTPIPSNSFTGAFPSSTSANTSFSSNPFGSSSSIVNNTSSSNPFGGFGNTQTGTALSSSFAPAICTQSISSFTPSFTSLKADAKPFLSNNNFLDSVTNTSSGPQLNSSIPLNTFSTLDTQQTPLSSLTKPNLGKLSPITSRSQIPLVVEPSPPPSPVSFQSFITFDWHSRKKTVDQILSRIPVINPKKQKSLVITPINDLVTSNVSYSTQAVIKSILKVKLRNRLILSLKKAIKEYSIQLIHLYLPATISLTKNEKLSVWKKYRKTLHLLSSGSLVPAAYAKFETGKYSTQIRNRINFESKCLWTHIPLKILFDLLSTIKPLPRNHKHCITICIPQSSWDLHQWYKERLCLEFDDSGEFLIKKLEVVFHYFTIEIRVIPRELPKYLFETNNVGFESISYSLIYCMDLPSLNWTESNYWNQESSNLFKFLTTLPNKYISIKSSLLINYTHPTSNSVSDFKYKSVEQLLNLYKYIERMTMISNYGTHITNGNNLADHQIDILRISYLL